MADRNVRIRRAHGKKPVILSLPKTASEALHKNSLVVLSSGYITKSSDNDTLVLGVILETVASTDSDYASTTDVQVELIGAGDLVEITTSAELTAGTAYGISNAYTVDQSDTSNNVFYCVKAISSTRALGVMKSVAGGNMS